MKQNKQIEENPYHYWKLVNIILACVILFLAILIILKERDGIMVPIVFFLGIIMCSLSGIMGLARNRKVVGYACSVFAGILAVALIMSIIRIW